MGRRILEINLQYFTERTTIGDNGCWNWVRAKDQGWYWKIKHGWKFLSAHRMSYAVLKSKSIIPDGLFICHKCDNPACCNPEHLFLGTRQENMDDMVNKWRQRTWRQYWNKHSARKVLVDGIEFESMVAAGKYFWITDGGVKKRFKEKVKYIT